MAHLIPDRAHLLRLSLAVSLAFGMAGCAATGATPSVLPPGQWGGQGVGLTLTEGGGSVEYDCAAGRIDESLRTDAAGRFQADGAHTPGTGGPERVDQPRPSHPALYEGRVEGGVMTLRVHVPETDADLGPFTLRRDAAPILHRCL